MPRFPGAHREFGFQPHDHALAVGVLRAHQRPGFDAVENQQGFRIQQRLLDPVGHLLRAAQPIAVARQEDSGRAVGRRVEELILLAPRDAAAVLGHPGVYQLVRQLGQRSRFDHARQPARAFERQREPGHVVVVVVDPTGVSNPLAADLAIDHLHPLGLRVADLGVHQAVQQVRLPPVVPGLEPFVGARRRPGHDTELSAGQTPELLEVPVGDRGLRRGCTVGPYLIHKGILPYQARPRSPHWLIHLCIAMPAATDALMLRVEPNCAIETTTAAPAAVSAVMPGPS